MSNKLPLVLDGGEIKELPSGDKIQTSIISDFDTEVSNNTSVVANTSKVSNATHTGDVTGSGVLTIGADKVTYAKIQNVVGNNRVLGRISGAGGVIQELSAPELRTMINVEDGANNYVPPASTSVNDWDLTQDATDDSLNFVYNG